MLGQGRRKGVHQPQGVPVALKNSLKLQTARAATLDGADPVGIWVEHRMTLALPVPFALSIFSISW
jgi:hypothetical protein